VVDTPPEAPPITVVGCSDRHCPPVRASRPAGCRRRPAAAAGAPHLCEDCQSRAVAAQQQAEADERERQEAEEEAAAQKGGGWLSRFRT
jgi:hypothetical protein